MRVIRQDNQGPAAARNLGLSEAQGEWVHFVDSDDLGLPNLHVQQLKALQSFPADLAHYPRLRSYFTAQDVVPINQVLQRYGLPCGDLVRALLTNG